VQQKLVSVAVAGALAAPCVALAQSSVEVTGWITTALTRLSYSPSTAGVPGLTKWDVTQGGSVWGLRGRESLGGGLTAWFEISQNAPMEQSNSVASTEASRNAAVGLQGPWGNVFMGSWYTPWVDLDVLWNVGTVGIWGPVVSTIGRRETHGTAPNPNCINNGSSGGFIAPGVPAAGIVCDAVEGGGGVGHPFWRRASEAVVYHSPTFNGVRFEVLYQTNGGKATMGTIADPSMWSTSLTWSGMGGRARIGAAFDSHKEFTAHGKTDTGWAIKGGYHFGVVDVGLAYESMTYRALFSDCKAKQYAIALRIPVARGSIRAAYSKAKAIEGLFGVPQARPPGVLWGAQNCNTGVSDGLGNVAGSTVPVAGNTGATQYNIGYQHDLSKRTDVGIGYAAIKNDPAAAFSWATLSPAPDGANGNQPFAGSDISMPFVSITHRF